MWKHPVNLQPQECERSIRHHFRNYLWLNNKQVLKASVSSFSPRFFFLLNYILLLRAQLARKKGCQRRGKGGDEVGEFQVAAKSEDEASVKRLCERNIKMFFLTYQQPSTLGWSSLSTLLLLGCTTSLSEDKLVCLLTTLSGSWPQGDHQRHWPHLLPQSVATHSLYCPPLSCTWISTWSDHSVWQLLSQCHIHQPRMPSPSLSELTPLAEPLADLRPELLQAMYFYFLFGV